LSERDSAFVEALVVHSTHALRSGDSPTILMTNHQAAEIASDRHPGIRWDDKQVERCKVKFISRPRDFKIATVSELLSEVVKGVRKQGEAVGVPSEYRPTGVLALLDA